MVKVSVSLLVFLFIYSCASASVLLEAGYETGYDDDNNSLIGVVEAYSDRIQASQDYARIGSWSLKTRLVYGDQTAFGSRAESDAMSLTPNAIVPGVERWFGFSLLLVPGYQYDTNSDVLFQIKQFSAGPFFSVLSDEGKLVAHYQYDDSGNGDNVVDESVFVDLCPYETGKWYDFVLRVVPEWESGNTGITQLWYKEAQNPSYTQVVNYSGLNLINQNEGYFKWGVYKSTWDTSATDSDERIVYHDAVAYGTSLSDVDPADGENYSPYFISNDFLSPSAYYSFDDSSDLASDDSGNGNDLLTNYTTSPAYYSNGIWGGSGNFNPTNGYDIKLSDTSPAIYPDGSHSVVFWASSHAPSSFMALSMPASLTGGYALYTSGSNWRVSTYGGTGGTLISDEVIVQYQWNHIAYTYEVTSGTGTYTGTGKLYINGYEVDSDSSMQYLQGGFRFGLCNRAGGTYHYDGVVDDFAVFDTVISPEEVWDLASADMPADEIATGYINETDATYGQAYSSTLADDAEDYEDDTLTFSKISGPAWLSVASNGGLSGTPSSSDVGLNTFEVQVTDSNGGSDTASLNIAVFAP
ncbi:MAG: heparin lyase I family protein [Sedimentisphaeraceae bacterium JB056]